eukprot:jgi/Botrbrau1/16813/Bobra.150_2s0040.1
MLHPDQKDLSFLEKFPARGFWTDDLRGGVIGRPAPSYIAEHDTGPRAGVVQSDPTNVIVQSLQAQPPKSRKREATGSAGAEPPTVRSRSAGPSGVSTEVSGAHVEYSAVDLQRRTVQELQTILADKNLPTRGRKEELIRRILDSQALIPGT